MLSLQVFSLVQFSLIFASPQSKSTYSHNQGFGLEKGRSNKVCKDSNEIYMEALLY